MMHLVIKIFITSAIFHSQVLCQKKLSSVRSFSKEISIANSSSKLSYDFAGRRFFYSVCSNSPDLRSPNCNVTVTNPLKIGKIDERTCNVKFVINNPQHQKAGGVRFKSLNDQILLVYCYFFGENSRIMEIEIRILRMTNCEYKKISKSASFAEVYPKNETAFHLIHSVGKIDSDNSKLFKTSYNCNGDVSYGPVLYSYNVTDMPLQSSLPKVEEPIFLENVDNTSYLYKIDEAEAINYSLHQIHPNGTTTQLVLSKDRALDVAITSSILSACWITSLSGITCRRYNSNGSIRWSTDLNLSGDVVSAYDRWLKIQTGKKDGLVILTGLQGGGENHPTADEFSVLEVDRDGRLRRTEKFDGLGFGPTGARAVWDIDRFRKIKANVAENREDNETCYQFLASRKEFSQKERRSFLRFSMKCLPIN